MALAGNWMMTRLTASAALAQVAAGAALIDLRTPAFQARDGHVTGARPVAKIDVLDTLRPEREAVLIVFCASDEASGAIVRVLRRGGFTRVFDVAGGFEALVAAGARVVKG